MAFRGLLARSSSAFFPLFSARAFVPACAPPPFLARAAPLLRLRPLVSAVGWVPPAPVLGGGAARCFSTRPTTSSLNDPSPNWSNRPPKETILLDGCDFEHWLVVMEPPEGEPTRDEIIDSYIKTLAQVVGSEDDARMKIYSVSTKHYFAFGALVSEELSYKIKALPRVRWVLPDSYLDVRNKDYGGEPFIDGKAVPYDPKYHEEWVRNNARANERSRRNDRPRNFDRSRNFERRRENMQNFQNRAASPMPNQQFQTNMGQNPPPPRDVPLGPGAHGAMPPMPSQGNMPPGSAAYQGPPAGNVHPGGGPHQGGGSAPQGPGNMYQGGGSGYQGGGGAPQGPGNVYQGGGSGYQGGGGAPQGPGNVYQGGGSGYQGGGGAPQGPGNVYQGGGSGYQGGGGAPQGPGNVYQGGGSGYQGGGSGGYPGGAGQHQSGGNAYQGGAGGGYPGGGNAYQGGGDSFQTGGNPYQGRDMPGRD